MSMAPCKTSAHPAIETRLRPTPLHTGTLCCLLALAALFTCTHAQALTSDRDKEMNIHSDTSVAKVGKSGQSANVTVLTGHVDINQGTLKVTSTDATIEQAPNGEISRVVLNGNPAHLEQRQDNGDMMRATAQKIVYLLANNTVDLTGHVVVNQQNRGEFSATHMIYNTVTGTMNSGAEPGGRVHMRILPHQKSATPAASAKPDSAKPAEGASKNDHP